MKTKAAKRLRSIKGGEPGRYSRARLRRVLHAVHVLEAPKAGEWVVRTLGERGATEQFDTKEHALAHALAMRGSTDVIVHEREPKKATVLRRPRKGTVEVVVD